MHFVHIFPHRCLKIKLFKIQSDKICFMMTTFSKIVWVIRIQWPFTQHECSDHFWKGCKKGLFMVFYSLALNRHGLRAPIPPPHALFFLRSSSKLWSCCRWGSYLRVLQLLKLKQLNYPMSIVYLVFAISILMMFTRWPYSTSLYIWILSLFWDTLFC